MIESINHEHDPILLNPAFQAPHSVRLDMAQGSDDVNVQIYLVSKS